MAYKFIGRTRGGRFVIDSFKLRMPLFGDLNRKTAISRLRAHLERWSRGVPILQALNITAKPGNAAIAAAISQVHDSVKEGESIVQRWRPVARFRHGDQHDRCRRRNR